MHLITLALHPVFAGVKVFRFDFGFLQKGIDLFNFFIFCKVGAWACESACSIFSQLFCLTFHSTISSWFPLLCYVGHFWANLDFAMGCWNDFFITHTTLCLSCVYSYSCRLLVVWGLAVNYWNNFLVTHTTLCSFCFHNYVCHLWADGNIYLVLDIRHSFYLHKTFLSYVQKVGSISVRK